MVHTFAIPISEPPALKYSYPERRSFVVGNTTFNEFARLMKRILLLGKKLNGF